MKKADNKTIFCMFTTLQNKNYKENNNNNTRSSIING